MKLRYPACSEVSGKRILNGTTIMDLTGGTMGMMNKQMYSLLKLAAGVGSDYYPEIMGNMFVVNAPYMFSGVWSMVKTFLDERTRAKIKIMSNGWKRVLLEHIDADLLPEFLGGNCTCKDKGGDCLRSNIGPWNDYEMTLPLGIRKKGSADETASVAAVISEVVE